MIDLMVQTFQSQEDEIYSASSWISAKIESGILHRHRAGYGTRVDGDRYFVTLPAGVTIDDVVKS